MDTKKFKDLYGLFGKRLYNYILWLTRNRQASEDIVQSVFMKIWDCPSVPGNDREAEAWIFTVARNQCMDFFRKCSRMSRLRIQYSRETPLYDDSDTGNRTAWDILGSLHEEDRSILYLHLKAGYSYKEIADMQKSNENAVRVRAFRALAKLRKRYVKESL